jgi:hypothetical protein
MDLIWRFTGEAEVAVVGEVLSVDDVNGVESAIEAGSLRYVE